MPTDPQATSSSNTVGNAASDGGLQHIDLHSSASIAEWSKKLQVTEEQLKEAVGAVGDRATDVEMHLKGTRATTNASTSASGGAGGNAPT